MKKPIRIHLPGNVFKIGMGTGDVIHIVTFESQKDPKLSSFNLKGESIWSSNLSSMPVEFRLADHGMVWVGTYHELHQFDPHENRKKIVNLPCQGNEQLGTFLVTPDGFLCCLHDVHGTIDPRIVRLDFDGNVLWSERIVSDQIAFEGIQKMCVHIRWQFQAMEPWKPENWIADYSEPLLLSGDYLLASFFEFPHSGIGISYCLDYTKGNILWKTEPRPTGAKAIAGNGRFLIGAQGYGAFDTYLYDNDGINLKHWQSHGYCLITESGEIRIVEMENRLPSNMHFNILRANGSIEKGPHLSGYYTTYPVIDKEGTVAFWRDGELILIDHDLKMHTLYRDHSISERALLSRILLTKQGVLVFAINNELWIVESSLKSLAKSNWPCGEGNLQGNPVVQHS